MTTHARLKHRIRERMARTGERYMAARRQVLGPETTPSTNARFAHHAPGSVPATAALRCLVTQVGLVTPHTRQPFSEAMLFGIAGGIGLGVFSFFYQREDFASFFLAGRHEWHDDRAYLTAALDRLNLAAVVKETTGARAAARDLAALTADGAPCVAWVDLASLPHRGRPDSASGSGYHVVTVLAVDAAAGTAVIGDLADEPIDITLADLATARARIQKQRHRLLALDRAAGQAPLPPLEQLIRGGLVACLERLREPSLPSPANARLAALHTWAERLGDETTAEGWGRRYRQGANLWRGLAAIHEYVEHYGTGGGLCRPLFADFLAEATLALGNSALAALATLCRAGASLERPGRHRAAR